MDGGLIFLFFKLFEEHVLKSPPLSYAILNTPVKTRYEIHDNVMQSFLQKSYI